MKRQRPFLVRLTKSFIGFKLTPVGRMAVLGIFLSAIGAISIEIPIYQIFCGMICLFGVIEFTGILFSPRIDVSAWLPDRVTSGESVTGYITIKNLGWFPACDIMCAMFGLPHGLRHIDADRSVRSVAPGETETLPFTIEALRRGEFLLPELRVHSTFPFNFMRFGKAKIRHLELLVVPDFEPMTRFDLPFSSHFQTGGVTVDSHSGQSTEFVGNRDYVPGIPVRRLDFKAWARTGCPVVREFQDEVTSDVALMFDSYQPSRLWKRSKQSRQFDAAIGLTAAIAHRLNQQSSSVEVFAAGPDLYLFQPSAVSSRFDTVLQVLAGIEPSRYDSLGPLTEAITEPLESIAVAICVFLGWDEPRERLVQGMLDSGIAVRVMIVSDEIEEFPVSDQFELTVLDPEDLHFGELIA